MFLPSKFLIGFGLLALLAVGAYVKGRSDGAAQGAAELAAERAAWQATYAEQAREAARIAASHAALSRKIADELEPKLDAATARGTDLAGRLRDYETRARRCPVPAAADAAGGTDAESGESGDGGGTGTTVVDAALSAHLAACARDSARVDAWVMWWAAVSDADASVDYAP